MTRTATERFRGHVSVTDECHLWTASVGTSGYGQFFYGGTMVGAHRVAWTLANGPIPEGLVIDHLCRVKTCVNPAHMELVTSGENTRRAMRTHCVNGHEFAPENTYTPSDGKRYCRECRRRRVREYRARRQTNVA